MDVSIIIVNYNSSGYTINCIDSIYKYTKDLVFEIIVIDNHSQTEDLNSLENHLNTAKFTLIKSSENLGFGGGNHLGVQQAKGNFLAFINNDAELTENSLLQLLQYSQSQLKVGCIGLKQINGEGQTFKYSYRQFIGLKHHLFNSKKPINYYSKLYNSDLSEPFNVDLVSGAFMFFKREAYEKSGGFDPKIFLFYEEMDICLRLKKQGYSTQFYPKSSFIHYMGKSCGNVALKTEFTVSYLYVIKKNYSTLYYQFLRFVLILKYGIKSIFKPKKHLTSFKIVLKGGNPLRFSMKPNC
ncbi:glycosyltransferase family 2 protein [Olleya sp. HaHaR_3_96]|uniref:glycosyltransferase family 2 protein n=1 Tax=Olleya sp. HaHaR_3_96 TaxID=2745560 RepID=UPI001C4F8091|nr:glycosyltransferase family 2 protein [Olleya sp. HaHaR_3_96]QXP61501.1 glycosyltransferase family 2 protein [Olleya sp. HaHaR_3_96]